MKTHLGIFRERRWSVEAFFCNTRLSDASFLSEDTGDDCLLMLILCLWFGSSVGNDWSWSWSGDSPNTNDSSSELSTKLAVQVKEFSLARKYGSGSKERRERSSSLLPPRNLQTCRSRGAMITSVVQAMLDSDSSSSLPDSLMCLPVMLMKSTNLESSPNKLQR